MLHSLTLVHTMGFAGYNASDWELTWRTSYIVGSDLAQLFDHPPAYCLNYSTAPKQPGRQAKTAASRADENWAPHAA
jgi:hypothetical protein